MMGSSASAASNCSNLMTSSLPQTPLPTAKQQQQQQAKRPPQSLLTSSTPMPLMRSETFVCDEEEQQLQESKPSRMCLEQTRLSSVGFGRTLDMDVSESGCAQNYNRTALLEKEQLELDKNAAQLLSQRRRTIILSSNEAAEGNTSCAQPDRTHNIIPASNETAADATQLLGNHSSHRADRTRPVIPSCNEPADATQSISNLSSSRADRTRPVIPSSSEATDATQSIGNLSSSRADRTRPVIPATDEARDVTQLLDNRSYHREDCMQLDKPAKQDLDSTLTHNLSLDLTKSMDQLPLLEHMSMPSGLDMLSGVKSEQPAETEVDNSELDVTLTALAPNKSNMKLPLNSTINTERLLDISGLHSPARHIQLLNLTREFLEQSPPCMNPQLGRRSVPQQSLVCLTPQWATSTTTPLSGRFQQSPVPVHLLSPLLKAARSDLVLPTRTPEGELLPNPLDGTMTAVQLRTPRSSRYSFGLDLQETTLDSSIELVDGSISSSQQQLQLLQQQLLKKQHSFDLDESLGILTPDQMEEFLDSSSHHNNNNSNAILNHQLELQMLHQQQHYQHRLQQQQQQQQHLQQQLRLEQTPSPEELPLDPIEPQLAAAIATPAPASTSTSTSAAVVIATSVAAPAAQVNAKLSNSFITSVTSVTSLDTGYQGDGEMSRPASRGACDHSPSNGPHLGRVSRQPSFPPLPMPAGGGAPMRRQDPMTDSDFFTESDADDVLQRGDRRAQVIDGQLYGPAMQPSASVPQLEDSCMESSGIFTDVENRCDEEMRLPELEVDMEMDVDMSPDESTQTLRKAQGQAQRERSEQQQLVQPRPLSSSSAATTLSNRTSYCSVDGGSAKSFCDEAFNASSANGSGSGSSSGSGANVNVFTRLTKSQSPTSPTASTAGAAKRLQPLMVKRGRSYSKDSQKSSHSDLSSLCNGNGSGSPKQLAKTPLRAAKKRDVRNLSISPTDLGPPPKTQQTAKGQSSWNKSLTATPTAIQKRHSVATTTTTTTTSSTSNTPLKLITKASQQKGVKNATGNATNNNKNGKTLAAVIVEESLRSGVDQTELQELNGLGLLLSSSQTPRDSKRASLSNELVCICGTVNSSCSCAVEKAPKVKRCGSHTPEPTKPTEPNGSALEQQQQQEVQSQKAEALEDGAICNKAATTNSSTNESLNDSHSTTTMQPSTANIVANYPGLKRYMDDGYLNYERLSKYFEANSEWQKEKDCQTLGLSIVIQFMSKQMETLSCRESKAKISLEETMALLQQTQHSCEELRQQLHEKDVEWSQRQQEWEHLQLRELQQAHEKVQEVQLVAKERFRELEAQLVAKDEEKKQALQTYHHEIAHQLSHKQQKLTAAEEQVLQLQTRLQEQDAKELQLREKLTRVENISAQRLSEATMREEQLQERIKSITKELQTLRASTEHKERDLRDRLALSEDEISVLRSSSQRRSPSRSSSGQSDTGSVELWRSEAESLRHVLDMKQEKIADLTKQNAELKRDNEEQRSMCSRLTLLESQNEMLRTELEAKNEKEKDLQRQMEEMQKAFNHESIKRKRLTCDKEELQYHLKQRSEQLQLVQAQLNELSNSSLDSSLSYPHSRCSSSRSCLESSHNSANTSPPATPVIMGVIKRNDSVSYVLEMDDETPQVAASKLVRRAGSLRSTSERSPTQRRQLSQSATAASNGHGQNGHSPGPNPLSQSMSATSVMRSHGLEAESPRPLCRARSQSVCTKASSQRQQPQRQTQLQPLPPQPNELTLPDWHVDELCSSSPHKGSASVEIRPRSSTMKLMSCVDAYPKALKKFQEIQESAGEAMVSGANSEDESCSASSEDMRSSSASSTASAAGCTLSKRQKQPSRMSIEEALMLEQISSLNGTPMEVSWSEDAADADVAAAPPLA
ncbi:AF4/FMR2 family member 4 isoform X3 [Drosophila navojoa]|uniref:AF4/FMR2 family member 4 isoform X3 n=1 Tax=Drosophila navojoa TaxID=7232 RepID=UPI0011BE0547|nr:AF4/FMR2 family member 4 isoform X3 [Drosophila navojoa]